MKRISLAASLAAVFALFAGSAARANPLASLRAHIAHELALVGPYDGARVYDVTAHRLLFAERARVARPPASVEKLYTATTALELLGPEYRLATRVLANPGLVSAGTVDGNLYLRGGGDPTFGSAAFIAGHYGGVGTAVRSLAWELARVDGIRRVTGRIVGDESFWDSLRGEPSSGYAFDPYLEGQLSALEFNRGQSGEYTGPNAQAQYAARQLLGSLRGFGVRVEGAAAAGVTPPGAATLAIAPSPTVAQLLGLTLPPSDNFFAESLVKDLGALRGAGGTTADGAAVVRATLAHRFGLHPRIVDGSGLSEQDRTSPEQVTRLLTALYPTAQGRVLRSKLAVAGLSGTLELRMRHTAAQGRCQGKTGTLTGVSNLAGYCRAADGHILAFAVFNDSAAIESAHTVQDNIAITLARYRG